MFCEKCGNRLNEVDKFCASCGNPLHQSIKTVSVTENDRRGYKRRGLIWLLSPVIVFVCILIIYALINVISQSSKPSPGFEFFDAVVIPLILGLAFISAPLTTAVSIYYFLKSKK